MKENGINVRYSGDFGEVRQSLFYKLNKRFDDKKTLSFKYVLSGEEHYIIDNKHISIGKGEALFFKDEKTYQGYIDYPKATMGLCIDLDTELMVNVTMDHLNEDELFLFHPCFNTQKIGFLSKEVHYILHSMVCEKKYNDALFMQELLQKLTLQVALLEEEFIAKIHAVPARNLSYKKELFKRLLKAKNYIHDNKFQKISLQDMAIASNLSSFYFQRLFRLLFGCSPSNYTEQLRLEAAKEKLQQSLTIKEIALAVGYDDTSYFCRRFKKRFGMTPKQYQKCSTLSFFSF